MQGYCDIYLWTILKRTSTEAHVYMRRHKGAKVDHFEVSNVIYHKFSYGAVSCTLNGENVNVKLELYVRRYDDDFFKNFIHNAFSDVKELEIPFNF